MVIAGMPISVRFASSMITAYEGSNIQTAHIVASGKWYFAIEKILFKTKQPSSPSDVFLRNKSEAQRARNKF